LDAQWIKDNDDNFCYVIRFLVEENMGTLAKVLNDCLDSPEKHVDDIAEILLNVKRYAQWEISRKELLELLDN